MAGQARLGPVTGTPRPVSFTSRGQVSRLADVWGLALHPVPRPSQRDGQWRLRDLSGHGRGGGCIWPSLPRLMHSLFTCNRAGTSVWMTVPRVRLMSSDNDPGVRRPMARQYSDAPPDRRSSPAPADGPDRPQQAPIPRERFRPCPTTLPARAQCSERHSFPEQPFVDHAAKVSGEANLTDVADCMRAGSIGSPNLRLGVISARPEVQKFI